MKHNIDPEQFQKTMKRGVDLIFACAGLLILSPVLLIIALLIKIDSYGSVIYRHNRVGKNGQPFQMFKFRSMISGNNDTAYMQYLHRLIESEKKHGDSALPYRKMDEDPRVTRVGRVLRRYYLDELPQLINVVKGDMSLIGPRPHVQFEVDHYTAEQYRRLAVKPGLSGLWQIEGKADCTFNELIELDLDYIDHWSLWLDLKIMTKTIYSLIRGGEKFIVRQGKGKAHEETAAFSEVERPLIQNHER